MLLLAVPLLAYVVSSLAQPAPLPAPRDPVVLRDTAGSPDIVPGRTIGPGRPTRSGAPEEDDDDDGTDDDDDDIAVVRPQPSPIDDDDDDGTDDDTDDRDERDDDGGDD